MLYPLRYVRRRLLVAAAKKRLAQERQLRTRLRSMSRSVENLQFVVLINR